MFSQCKIMYFCLRPNFSWLYYLQPILLKNFECHNTRKNDFVSEIRFKQSNILVAFKKFKFLLESNEKFVRVNKILCESKKKVLFNEHFVL